jgi:hypothetical protein
MRDKLKQNVKAPPFFKGRCPAKGGTEGLGNKFTKKIPSPILPIGRGKN